MCVCVYVFSVLFHLLTPEQPYFFCPLQQPQPEMLATTYPVAGTVNSPAGGSTCTVGLRRCRALYDCDADNEDELSFREGEVIIVTNEQTDDENWMEGAVETDPSRRGMFPISFVHMLADWLIHLLLCYIFAVGWVTLIGGWISSSLMWMLVDQAVTVQSCCVGHSWSQLSSGTVLYSEKIER